MDTILLTPTVIHALTLNPKEKTANSYKILAVGGDALLRLQIVTFLINKGISSQQEMAELTAVAVCNKNLAVIFDSMPTEIQLHLHTNSNGVLPVLTIVRKATIIEALLYATFIDKQYEVCNGIIAKITKTIPTTPNYVTSPWIHKFQGIVMQKGYKAYKQYIVATKEKLGYEVTVDFLEIKVTVKDANKETARNLACKQWFTLYEKK